MNCDVLQQYYISNHTALVSKKNGFRDLYPSIYCAPMILTSLPEKPLSFGKLIIKKEVSVEQLIVLWLSYLIRYSMMYYVLPLRPPPTPTPRPKSKTPYRIRQDKTTTRQLFYIMLYCLLSSLGSSAPRPKPTHQNQHLIKAQVSSSFVEKQTEQERGREEEGEIKPRHDKNEVTNEIQDTSK